MHLSGSTHQPAARPSARSNFTLRFVVGLMLMAASLGWIFGFAISRYEPGLFVAALVVQAGFALLMLEERRRARSAT
jgi:hypothetical protein